MVHPSMAEPDCCVLPTVMMAGASVGKVEDEMRLIDRSLKEEECTSHLDCVCIGTGACCVHPFGYITWRCTRNDMICLVRRAEW